MKYYFLIYTFLFVTLSSAFSQSILIDRGVLVDGLWCFPLVDDTLTYKYLPNRAQLALDENRKPQFSFLRYVNSLTSDENPEKGSSGINDLDGGAVVHFLVNYGNSEEVVLEAEKSLQNKYFNPSIKIKGPIIFEKGTYTLISSVVGSSSNKNENQAEYMVVTGSAPVLEGSNIAISLELNKDQGKLLYESFKMPTPDISLLFDMTFKGLSNSYNAELLINWSEYYKQDKLAGSIGIYGSSAEIEKEIEENFKTQSIQLKTIGEDAKSEALLESIYQKLISLLYEEAPVNDAAEKSVSEITDITKAISTAALKVLPYSATIKYKKKNIKRAGTTTLSLNSKTTVNKNYTIAFNIGNIYKRYGDNPEYFKSVSLEDSDYNRRDITVTLDGELEPEFDKFINSVTVQLNKTHENNEITVRELKLTKATLGKINNLVLSYGVLSDKDKMSWLNYECKILYEFVGGKKYETPWQSQSNSIINVYVPFERKLVELSGDQNILNSKKVRAIVVSISYDLFGQTHHSQKTIRTKDLSNNISIPIMVPKGNVFYTYKITYIYLDGSEITRNNESTSEILFLDNEI